MIHPTALVNLKPCSVVRSVQKHTHTQPCVNLTSPSSLKSAFPPFTFPSHLLCSTQTHARTHQTTHNHSAWPLPHDLSSLLPWQGSLDEIRMTTGMTQSVAVESLHRVK